MAIINRGIFQLTDTVFERAVGNDWPTAQVLTTFEVAEGSNLYYTNARVLSYVETLNLGANLSANTTTDLAEGDNLYYTNARVQAYLNEQNIGGIDLSGNTTTDLAEGDNLYYTNARVLAHLAESDVTVQDLLISGNLVVEGNTITLNTETVIVEDKNILLANGAINAAAADGAGINIDGAQANITYVSTGDKFLVNKVFETTENFIGDLTGDVTGTVSSLSNHTTTALAEGDNLYYSNARVYANLLNTSVNVHSDIHFNVSLLQEDDILIWDGTKFIAQQVNAAVAANVAELVLSLALNTTDNLAEGNTNLYFTEDRVVDALTPGRGITISQTGIISSVDDSADFNLLLDGGVGKLVEGTLSNVLVFPSPASTSDRFILRTIQVTNISDEEITVSGNMLLTGNAVTFANHVPIPEGGSIEFLKRAQAFNRNDSISMIGYAANGSPIANVAAVSFSYETVPTTAGLFSTGKNINSGNVNHTVFDFGSTYGVLESLKLVNLDTVETKAKVIWADSAGNVISYFAYNLPLPPNSSVEVLSATKRINTGNKILVQTNNDSEISTIISGRLGDITQLLEFPTTIISGQTGTVYWETDVPDGTTIYYSIE